VYNVKYLVYQKQIMTCTLVAFACTTQIVPFFGDQPFWGRRVAALGAGPAPLDRKTLNAIGLAKALTAMAGPPYERARRNWAPPWRGTAVSKTRLDFLNN
jgi:sterol 3beta-glucosyltransferase